MCTLTIDSKLLLKELENNKNLISTHKDYDKYKYTLISNNKEELQKILDEIRDVDSDIQYNLNI